MAAEAKVPSVREQIPTAEFIEDLTAYMSKEGTAEAVIEKLQRMYSALKFIEQKLVQRKAKLKAKIPEIEATYGALKQMRSQAELGEPLIAHYELAQSVFAKAKVNVHEEDKVTPPPHRTLAFHTRTPRTMAHSRAHALRAARADCTRARTLTCTGITGGGGHAPTQAVALRACQVCLWLGANVMLEYPRDEAILLLEDNLKNAKAALVTLVDDMGHLRDQITVTEVNMARVFNWDVKVRRARRPTPSRALAHHARRKEVGVDRGGMARREQGGGGQGVVGCGRQSESVCGLAWGGGPWGGAATGLGGLGAAQMRRGLACGCSGWWGSERPRKG